MLPEKRARIGSTLSVVDSTSTEKHHGDLASDSQPIDEDLHSRQTSVYGHIPSKVLISGMQGLGVEIAKNIILAGCEHVTLHDEGDVELWDLSSSYIFCEEDVGINRALTAARKLRGLKSSVISALTTKLTKEHLSNFEVVVFTDINLEKAIEFDDCCHQHRPPIAFIKSEVRGLFGSVFCDFGPEFTVLDVDGEDPHTGIIAFISNDNPTFVACVDDERLKFQDGDLVVFSEVKGMTELNDGRPRKIKSARPYSFTIEEDTTNYGMYERGGIVTQVKEPILLKFKPLQQALQNPGEFIISDCSKFDRPPLLHLAFQALDKFIVEFGRYPRAGSEEDAPKLIALVVDINNGMLDSRLEEFDQKLLRNFAFGAKAVLNPMAVMFGGIVGQEVVKACSGKFRPLFQFFYFDSVESLPTKSLDRNELTPLNSRHDAQISVFGSKLQKKLEEAKVLIVGTNALGFEFLKNVATMGVCCGDGGKLTITNGDVLEESCFGGQFHLLDWDNDEADSELAASATNSKVAALAASLNPHLHLEVVQNRGSPETKSAFVDTFWNKLSAVINAVDHNTSTRLQIDQWCMYFGKALLEMGTSGIKCNTQMVIPGLTEKYVASTDPHEEELAPLCTVQSFPYKIDHCLTLAKSEFDSLFEKTPAEVNAYLGNPRKYISSKVDAGDVQALERVLECLDKDTCITFQDCIIWARLKFEYYFANQIKKLTNEFCQDAVTSRGTPFWSPPKRFPKPLEFSSNDLTHLQFIKATAILRAETFGIPIPNWVKSKTELIEAVDKVIVPDSLPWEDVNTVGGEETTGLLTDTTNDVVIRQLINKLERCRKNLLIGGKINPTHFKKDDDTNCHMHLITSLANLRARNYRIPEIDKVKAKFIIGKTIPEIATSTAIATGLVCLELYKVLDGNHKTEDYRNTFVNLALPEVVMTEPVPPTVTHYHGLSWTFWDRWIYSGDPTVRELLQWLENRGLNGYNISYERHLLYSGLIPTDQNLLDYKLVDLVTAITELPRIRRHFDVTVTCEDDEGDDIDIPMISIYFK